MGRGMKEETDGRKGSQNPIWMGINSRTARNHNFRFFEMILHNYPDAVNLTLSWLTAEPNWMEQMHLHLG